MKLFVFALASSAPAPFHEFPASALVKVEYLLVPDGGGGKLDFEAEGGGRGGGGGKFVLAFLGGIFGREGGGEVKL